MICLDQGFKIVEIKIISFTVEVESGIGPESRIRVAIEVVELADGHFDPVADGSAGTLGTPKNCQILVWDKIELCMWLHCWRLEELVCLYSSNLPLVASWEESVVFDIR